MSMRPLKTTCGTPIRICQTKLKKKGQSLKYSSRQSKLCRIGNKYSYSAVDFLYNTLCVFKCLICGIWCCRTLKLRHRLFNRGVEKFEREMDLVSFIKTVRRVEMLINSHFTAEQKMLEICQYSNVINLERDEEENEPDVNKLERSLTNYTTDKIEFKDVALLEGIYSRKISDSSTSKTNNYNNTKKLANLNTIKPVPVRVIDWNDDNNSNSASRLEQSKTMGSRSRPRLYDEENSFEQYRDNSIYLSENFEIKDEMQFRTIESEHRPASKTMMTIGPKTLESVEEIDEESKDEASNHYF